MSLVPAKLAINLSIHKQHTYDNGVDRTGRQGMEEKYSITWGEGGEKKKFTPRLCSIAEYSVRTEKNTSAQKHIYHKHMTLQQGKHIQLWQAAIRSGAIYCGAGRRPARQRGGTKRPEAVGRGRGVMSVIREGARESHCSALPRVVYPAWPWPRQAGAGEPEKIRLNCCVFGAKSCIPSQLFSLSILSILVSESINFHLQSRELHRDRIHIPVNSLSLNADRSSHCFYQNGQLCEALDSCSRLLNFSITQGKA